MFIGWPSPSGNRLLACLPAEECRRGLPAERRRPAQMLGVRHEGVTATAGKLQDGGVLNYSRGRITVLDRPALEARVCECYTVVRDESARILPTPPASRTRSQPFRGS